MLTSARSYCTAVKTMKLVAAAVMNGKNIATEKAMRQWVADRESL